MASAQRAAALLAAVALLAPQLRVDETATLLVEYQPRLRFHIPLAFHTDGLGRMVDCVRRDGTSSLWGLLCLGCMRGLVRRPPTVVSVSAAD